MKKKYLLIIIAAISIASLFLFTGGKKESGGAGAKPEEMTTISMVYWPGPESEAMKVVVDWYNSNKSSESGVTVEMVLFGREGFWEKQDMMMAAGSSEVDLYFTASYIVGKHAPYLEPLDSYFDKPELSAGGSMDTFLDSATDSLKVDGMQYAVPMDVSNHFLYYRTDLIDKLLNDRGWQSKYTAIAKAELGKNLRPKPVEDWLWDDFIAVTLFFTEEYNSESPTKYGTALMAKNIIYNTMVWNNVLYSLGGSWFKDDGQPAFDTPEAKEAVEVFLTIVEKGATPAGSTTYEYPEALEALKTGKVAVLLQWSAAFFELFDPEKSPVADSLAIAPIPGPKHVTHVHALGVGLNKKSKNKDIAFKWISFLSTQEAMKMYAGEGGIPPVGAVLDGMGEERPVFPVISEHVGKYGYVESTSAETVPILEILSKRLSAAWAGEMSVDEALATAQKEVSELLSR